MKKTGLSRAYVDKARSTIEKLVDVLVANGQDVSEIVGILEPASERTPEQATKQNSTERPVEQAPCPPQHVPHFLRQSEIPMHLTYDETMIPGISIVDGRVVAARGRIINHLFKQYGNGREEATIQLLLDDRSILTFFFDEIVDVRELERIIIRNQNHEVVTLSTRQFPTMLLTNVERTNECVTMSSRWPWESPLIIRR